MSGRHTGKKGEEIVIMMGRGSCSKQPQEARRRGGELMWVVRQDSPERRAADLRGKRTGWTDVELEPLKLHEV